MHSENDVLSPAHTWMLEQWLEQFSQTLEAMSDTCPKLAWQTEKKAELGSNPILHEEKLGEDATVWFGVPEQIWQEFGSNVLKLAGVEEVSELESRNTFLEIIQQSLGGLVQAMSRHLQRDIPHSSSQKPSQFPEGQACIKVIFQDNKHLPPLFIAFAPTLERWFAPRAEGDAEEVQGVREAVIKGDKAKPSSPSSKTFDLLLDVALPVSVSFGRTELAVKEVLKLTTGSIVELNRSVTEPVEIIVNNCVIARGEVVVVDGNYGVRIHQIASRQERLRTGTLAGMESTSNHTA
jgi:flagellar motor switch protein FliN